MAKVSKYQKMIGQEVREGVRISDYRRLVRISTKSGKSYYRYELELNEVLWVSTQSFNKGSYMKRLAKAMNSLKTQNKAPQSVSKAQEVDEQGLTPKERRSLLKRFGYVGTYTSEGFIRADVYEAMKAQEVEQTVSIDDDYIMAFEIELMCSSAYAGVKCAKGHLVRDVQAIIDICQRLRMIDVEKYLNLKFGYILNEMRREDEFSVALYEEVKYQLRNDYGKWIRSVWAEVVAKVCMVGEVKVRVQKVQSGYFGMFVGKNERECKRVYRTWSKKLHPDLNPNANPNEFIKLQEAYECGLALARTNTTYHTWKLWKSNFSHVCTYEEFVA